MYIPLHVHSCYSVLRGTAGIDVLVSKAKQYKLPYLALTDTNGMYGLIQFAAKLKEEGIKPVLGVCIDEPGKPDLYALIIPINRTGYAEMCSMITARKLRDDFSLFRALAEPLPNLAIITPSMELLEKIGRGEMVFAELITTPARKPYTRRLYHFARERGIPLVASNPVYFAEAGDYLLHKVVAAIRERSTLANIDPKHLEDEGFYFRDPAELEQEWKGLPEALANTRRIAEAVDLDLRIGEFKFPTFPVDPPETSYSLLWKLAFDGLRQRYGVLTDAAVNRLNYEIGVIKELNFVDYFLVVWDILREARRRGMMTLGRGSAGNSLVSYCLGFTDVDPIKYDLYFERFLNKSRTTPPDVDIDFSWRERDEIIKYVFDKYGYDRVAMISTTVTFRARSAFRETAKVFGISEAELSEYSKLIPWTDARNLPDIAARFPEARSLKFDTEPWKTIVNLAARLAGFPRHLSIHPSGIVIAPEPITRFCALEFAKNKGLGLIVTQPDMYPVEELGLVKIDLLSQRALGVLRDTVDKVKTPVEPCSAPQRLVIPLIQNKQFQESGKSM